MIPCDLEAKHIELPPTDQHTIVLFTDASHGELLCERFALRVQQDFGDQVLAWFMYQPQVDSGPPQSLWVRIWTSVTRELRLVYHRPSVVFSWFDKSWTMLQDRLGGRHPLAVAQDRMLGEEIRSLRTAGKLSPIPIDDSSRAECVAQVQRLNPYFFLSLGETPNVDELRPAVRGIMLNQHVGWCPDHRGAHSVYWAMYHRELGRLGATIHASVLEANAGPIFRRAPACLLPHDDALNCYVRSAVLGTELMCETVGELVAKKRATVFEQPCRRGLTHRAEDLDREVRQRIREDFAGQWLGTELRRARDY